MPTMPTEEDYARLEEKRGAGIRGVVRYGENSWPAVLLPHHGLYYWTNGRWSRSHLIGKKNFTPVATEDHS